MIPQGSSGADWFRAVLDTVFAASAYRWAEEPRPLRLLREWWDQLGEWLRGLRADNPLVFRLLVIGLLLLLVLIFSHAAYVVWRTVSQAGGPKDETAPRALREARDAAWYAREADRAAREGRYLEALQLAFVELALTLDTQGLLQYHAGKTPAECAREARLAGSDRERLRDLVRNLYSYAFGGRSIAPDDYQRWRENGAGPWHAPAH